MFNILDSILKVENFNPNKEYEQISLFYCGKPILIPGQTIETLDTNFAPHFDPIGVYKEYKQITDYLSADEELSFELLEGSVNEVLLLEADRKKNRIFNVCGNWLFAFDPSN